MNKSVVVKKLLKLIFSFVLAIVLLSLLSYFYFNEPRAQNYGNSAVDFHYPPDTLVSKLTEGVFFGKTNNEGLWNEKDFKPGDTVDILLMGTSHMRGNIRKDFTIAHNLNNLFDNKYCYSIGAANHILPVLIKNFKYAERRYNPRYVVLEYNSGSASARMMKELILGFFGELLQENKETTIFFPLLNQLKLNLSLLRFSTKASLSGTKQPIDLPTTAVAMKTIKDAADKYNSKIIILYHPETNLNSDGELVTDGTEEERNILSKCCNIYGFSFLDLSDTFVREYNQNHILPHGFANTAVGTGHLNKEGNRMVAQELYNLITELESET